MRLPVLLAAVLALPAIAAAPADRPEDPGAHGRDRAAEARGVAADEAPAARVVVSPIDSGINPYHEAFAVNGSAVDEDVLAAFGVDDAHVLRISDSYADDVAAGVYDGVVEGETYWFEGTNILVRSYDFGDRAFLPDDERDTHGTGVTGAVAAANPEAIILFVEGITSDSERFAFTHPEVDIVTTSYGFVTSAPLGALAGSYDGVVGLGKLHFGASANDPTLAPSDGTSGPWWAIGIAGFGEREAGDGGKEILSGSAPDFVADWTQDLPYCATCTSGTRSVSGTSFATPRSAGIASSVLLELRRAAGHAGGISEGGLLVDTAELTVSNWQLRRALEEGAVYPDMVVPLGRTEIPVLADAPYTQVGWGLLTTDADADVAGRTLAALDGAVYKSADACDFMTDYMTARFAMWDANPLSDSFGQTNAVDGSEHYISC